MKKSTGIVWGVLLIVLGIVFALRSFEIVNFDLFFDGWWTLFLIVPSLVGLFTQKEKSGNIICFSIGCALLLASLGIIEFEILGKLIVPLIVVGVGAKLIYNSMRAKRADEIMEEMKKDGDAPREGYATFSGCDMNFDGEVFRGCEICAAFGGAKCDLRGAVIESDSAIKVTAIFGGVEILVPNGINVKVNSNSVFGGVSNKANSPSVAGAPTIYINALCMFGGAEIK